MPTYGSLWPTYAKQWDSMTVRPSRLAEFNATAKRLFNAKERYMSVQNKTGVPWYMIAVIHERESSQNWNTQLAQGDPLRRKSTHIPRGMGPYSTWEEGAIAGLKYDGLTKVKDWRLEKVLYHLEQFNGWGYNNHGVPSAYVWAGSNIYNRGKYIADGVWSKSAVDIQPGCAPLIKALMNLDPTINPERETADDVAPTIVVKTPSVSPTEPVDELKPVTPTPVAPVPVAPKSMWFMPNAEQISSIARAILLATGSVLTTLGVTSDEIWQPIVGVVMAVIPVVWGMIVHKRSNAIETVAAMPDVIKVEVRPTSVGVAASNANDDSLVVINSERGA